MKKGDKVPVYNAKTLQKMFESQVAQAYAMVFFFFFTLAFFTIFAIRPTMISFFTLQKQIEDAKVMNTRLDDKINSLLEAKKTYESYQTEIALLEKALPKDPQFAQLIQKLEIIVNDREATTSSFSTKVNAPSAS